MQFLIAVLVVAGLMVSGTPAHGAPFETSRLSYPMAPGEPHLRLAQAPSTGDKPGSDPPKAASGRVGNVLRAVALPGWGQIRSGHKAVGVGFVALEAAVWSTFAVSIFQGKKRKDSYEDTASLFAGIDLDAVDDRFRFLVGQFDSSDEYNRLVVLRDAQIEHFGDAEAIESFFEKNKLQGEETWSWEFVVARERYSAQRRSSEKAFQRAEFAVGAAVINRFLSALTTARLGSR